jgi:hypothetical protein
MFRLISARRPHRLSPRLATQFLQQNDFLCHGCLVGDLRCRLASANQL